MSQVSRVISIKDFKPSQFRWLTLKLIEWRDPAGKLRLWESAERTTRSASGVDAVAIVAKAMSRLEPARCILVSQFRPPLDAICLEMPAGTVSIFLIGVVLHLYTARKFDIHVCFPPP